MLPFLQAPVPLLPDRGCHSPQLPLMRSKDHTPSTPLSCGTPVRAPGNRLRNGSDHHRKHSNDCIYTAPCFLGSLRASHYGLKHYEQP